MDTTPVESVIIPENILEKLKFDRIKLLLASEITTYVKENSINLCLFYNVLNTLAEVYPKHNKIISDIYNLCKSYHHNYDYMFKKKINDIIMTKNDDYDFLKLFYNTLCHSPIL